MLAHEVLGRRGLHFPFFCCLSALLCDGRGYEPADRDCRAKYLEESAARRIDLFDHVSLPTPKLCCAMQKAPIPGQANQTGSFLRSWSYNAITSLGFPMQPKGANVCGAGGL